MGTARQRIGNGPGVLLAADWSFRFLVRNLRHIVPRFFFGAAVFVSPSLLRLLRKLRLPIGTLCLSEFGLKLGLPALILMQLGLSALSFAKCEPDKSEQQ